MRFQAGVPVNQLDDRGFTPLAYAVSNKDVGPDILKILIESGADVNVAAKQLNVAIHERLHATIYMD